MCQGNDKTGMVGTDAMFVMTLQDVTNMPADRFATYANIVVDYRPQKEDPHRIRIMTGGNLINHPGELTTITADITTSKLHWNSVLSTQKAKYMCLDLKSFYLSALLERYEYMRIPIGMRAFLHGMESRPHKAHQIERGIFYIVCNFTIRRRVCRRSRTRSIIPKLQASNNFSTHASRNGTPQTTNANTLR